MRKNATPALAQWCQQTAPARSSGTASAAPLYSAASKCTANPDGCSGSLPHRLQLQSTRRMPCQQMDGRQQGESHARMRAGHHAECAAASAAAAAAAAAPPAMCCVAKRGRDAGLLGGGHAQGWLQPDIPTVLTVGRNGRNEKKGLGAPRKSNHAGGTSSPRPARGGGRPGGDAAGRFASRREIAGRTTGLIRVKAEAVDEMGC